MEDLYATFKEAAGSDDDATISSPGVAGIVVLLQTHNVDATVEKVQVVFDEMGWDAHRSFSWCDFQLLVDRLENAVLEEASKDSDEDHADEQAKAMSAIVDVIAGRMEEKTFPYVLPGHLKNDGEISEAEEALTYVQKVEAVEVQSFIDNEWDKYEVQNPGDENLPRAVKRAQWARQFYYPLLREFYCTKAYEKMNFAIECQEAISYP